MFGECQDLDRKWRTLQGVEVAEVTRGNLAMAEPAAIASDAEGTD